MRAPGRLRTVPRVLSDLCLARAFCRPAPIALEDEHGHARRRPGGESQLAAPFPGAKLDSWMLRSKTRTPDLREAGKSARRYDASYGNTRRVGSRASDGRVTAADGRHPANGSLHVQGTGLWRRVNADLGRRDRHRQANSLLSRSVQRESPLSADCHRYR